MTGLYDPDRVQKISEIMPTFLSVAEPGHEVYRGLEGDPEFKPAFRGERPTWTIENVNRSEGTVDVVSQDGVRATLDTLSLRPENHFEFKDSTFAKIMEERTRTPEPEYRGLFGGNEDLKALRAETESLRREMGDMARTFANSVLELSKDLKAMRRGDEPKFANSLRSQFEASAYRGAGSSDPGAPTPLEADFADWYEDTD